MTRVPWLAFSAGKRKYPEALFNVGAQQDVYSLECLQKMKMATMQRSTQDFQCWQLTQEGCDAAQPLIMAVDGYLLASKAL